jgi:hypothetical protein
MQEAANKAFAELKALAGMKENTMPNMPSLEALTTLGWEHDAVFTSQFDRLQKWHAD